MSANYIQKNIGGKPRGLKFMQGALMIYQEIIDPAHILATASYAIVYAGLKCNAIVKRQELLNDDGSPTTFEQVCEWVEEMTKDDLLEIIKCWNEAVYGWQQKGVLVKPEEDETVEKKSDIVQTNIEEIVTDQPVS